MDDSTTAEGNWSDEQAVSQVRMFPEALDLRPFEKLHGIWTDVQTPARNQVCVEADAMTFIIAVPCTRF